MVLNFREGTFPRDHVIPLDQSIVAKFHSRADRGYFNLEYYIVLTIFHETLEAGGVMECPSAFYLCGPSSNLHGG